MPTYAIIEASGGQLRVAEGDELLIDLVDGGAAAAGKHVKFDKVLLVAGGTGASSIGTPYVAGASVSAEIVAPSVQGEKIYIYKHREKKTYKRKTGHRQRYTKVRITGIKA
jgi:large subunit ribosomal protein L21